MTPPTPAAAAPDVPVRRPPTEAEARALASVLRQRILRLTATEDLTNRQLADRLAVDPATALYHLRILVEAGLVEQLPPRAGTRGAREKPYRSTRRSWWLESPLAGAAPELQYGPVALSVADLGAAGPAAVSTFATFALHLSQAEVDELDARLVAVLDSYVATDSDRADAGSPVHRGFFVLHRPATP
ncbi:MAG: winged helix-turn-helix domain-containing protein [Propionicimonas sp.]